MITLSLNKREYDINVQLKKENIKVPNEVLKLFPKTKPENIELEKNADETTTLKDFYQTQLETNDSFDDRLTKLEENVDYLRKLKSPFFYSDTIITLHANAMEDVSQDIDGEGFIKRAINEGGNTEWL